MNGLSHNSSQLGPIDDVAISLAGLSIIGCIIALVVLIYFKLYRSFIYRLVLYSFLSLIIFSLSTPIFYTTFEYYGFIALIFFFVVSLTITFVLVTIMYLCVCILTICNHQFTYRADIVLVISLVLVLFVAGAISLTAYFSLPIILIIPLTFLINMLLTVLTLVPLCSRACGYNMCVKTVRTRESHRKALKGILPLFILPLLSYLPFFMIIYKIDITMLVSSALGLIAVLSFALHLCFIGKANLCKQRDIKKSSPQADYGTVNQPHTDHCTTVHTAGVSGSNTNT